MGQPGLERGEWRLMGHLWRAASSSPCPVTMPVVELIPAFPHLIFAETFLRVSTVHVIDKLRASPAAPKFLINDDLGPRASGRERLDDQ